MAEGLLADDDRRLSRAEAEAEAALVAGVLLSMGLKEDDRIALLMRNETRCATITLGAALIGVQAVQINWRFTADEVAFLLADSDAKALFAHGDLWAPLSGHIAAPPVVTIPTPPAIATAWGDRAVDGNWDDWLSGATPFAGRAVPFKAPVFYTSGTTGRPKGVLRFGAPPVALRGTYNATSASGRTLLAAPFHHSAPNRNALGSFRAGGGLFLAPRFDAQDVLRRIEAERITHALLVPTMMIRLLRLPEEVRAGYDVSSIEHICTVAAPCPPEVKRAMIDWFGPVIYEFYGSTETSILTYCNSADALARPGTVGRALPDARLAILDEAGRECPPGEVGEVFGRSTVTPDFTYLNAPEARAEIERDGLWTSGDMGWLDADGFLFLSDRKKDMVISGGVNIYPAQVEAALLARDDITDCAVFGLPDDVMGERVVALIQPHLDVQNILSFLKSRIAGYMIPKEIRFTDSLPRTDSGKVNKRALRAAWLAGEYGD